MSIDNNPSPPTAAEDVHSGGSQDEEDAGWSGDETTHTGSGLGPRKRKRQRYDKTSCELCKARKVKCDRAEPACSWCARHNRTCVYLERQKPGSRIGFGLELEAKVNKLDAHLQALERRVDDHLSAECARPVPQSTTVSDTPALQHQYASQSQYEYHQQDAAGYWRTTPISQAETPAFPNRVWNPTVDHGSGAEQANLSSGHLTPRQSIAERLTPKEQTPLLTPSAPSKTPLTILDRTDLPPQPVVHSLVDLYFKHCNTWCPILDRKTTFEAFFDATTLTEEYRVLLHAIVATTLRFYNDDQNQITLEQKKHHHSVSKNVVQVYALENTSIAALRALVILCLDELGTSCGPRGWNLLSLLAQYVRQLNLCEETSVYLHADADDVPRTGTMRRVAARKPESWIEDEGRRRLCWMVYILDRYATIAVTTFDFVFDDSRMKRVLPCSYDLFSRGRPVETRSLDWVPDHTGMTPSGAIDKPENLGSFSYHCEILSILSKVHNFLKAPIDITSTADMSSWRNTYQQHDNALDKWLQSLPSEYSRISSLCHSDPASRVANWFMLHSAFVVAVVRLHSPAAYPTMRSHLLVPSHYAKQRCLSAVQSLRSIVQDVCEANALDLLGPLFAFSMWVAARLLLVHAAAMESSVDGTVDFFIEKLGRIGKNWEVASNYAKILSRVVERGRQSDMSFTAMRKSAHDLVTLASSTRRSGSEQSSTQVTTLDELDNIDIFDFFHYPNQSLGSQCV